MKDPIPRTQKKKIQREDLSFIDSLVNEWKLFWENIVEEEAVEVPTPKPSEDEFINGKLEQLSLEQIKAITKALSADRKKLNQKLEGLNKELEENAAKMESLALVGGDQEEALAKASELHEQGIKLSEQLHKLDERLKIARQKEDRLKKAAKEIHL